jgi:hypothetical protein
MEKTREKEGILLFWFLLLLLFWPAPRWLVIILDEHKDEDLDSTGSSSSLLSITIRGRMSTRFDSLSLLKKEF